ncbi:MAG TPA: hypothetical protein H9873_02160 [Candidatus Dorea gallistercoris]|uniref:Rhomboid family intramembrane serine protease n=1 Tax=Candidatus Dorea gallistercoris TaxID=2838542 RepID=A0A9D1UDC5_9FIRM|nr:hypothetical protein [Candidatus Dorea gallistercoris]
MNWLNKLERKFGRYAIPNLMTYIVILYGVGYVLNMVNPTFYAAYLSLDAQAILHGQVWRIFTFIIQPPSNNLIWLLLALYLYYFIGKQLEMTWGAFRFNLYLLAGVLFHAIAAILAYLVTGVTLYLGTTYLNMSLFLVFAALYPDVQFMLYFFIPVKAKWLAWLDVLFFLYGIAQAFLPAYGGGVYGAYYQANALAAAVSLLNFVIFFIGSRNGRAYSPKQMRRKREFQKNVRRASRPAASYPNGAKHRCAVCGRTELDDPNLEFRYCSKCNGNYEYCQDHLFTHTHVK